MTKRNLLLLSLLVVFGLAATAPSLYAAAGTAWNLSSNTNYFARNEGDAEGVGTVTLTSSTTGTVAASTYVYVDYNAPIAWNGTASTPYYSVAVTFGGPDAATLASCVAVSIESYVADFSIPPIGKLTNNGIVLAFGGPTSPTSCATTPISVGDSINVVSRVMIETYPDTFAVQANVRAQYYNTGYPLTLNQGYPQNLELAEVEGGESATYSTATATTFYQGPENVLTCIGVYGTDFATVYDYFALNVMENWPNALTSLSDEYSLEHDTVTTAGPGFNGVAGAPTNGSNILVTFFHIPPTVEMEADHPVPCEELSTTDPYYCAGGLLEVANAVVGTQTTGSDGLGVQWFWYDVEKTNVGVIESVNLGFYLDSTVGGPLPTGQKYQITAQITLTDDYPEDGSSSQVNGEMPYFTEPEGPPFPVVNFIDCRTELLFPYINTYQGGTSAFSSFGTGIDVANTTVDPFALPTATCVPTTGVGCTYPDLAPGSAVPQSGSCAFYFYPGSEAAYTLYTTPTISAGGSFAFDVGSVGFSANTGYAIAICGFQNAHAFAEIYDNYVNLATSGPTATLAYLADVLPDPGFYPRSPAGELLGETAIAPIFCLYGDCFDPSVGTGSRAAVISHAARAAKKQATTPAARKH